MAIIVDMPRLSDTMEEGTIAGWLKDVGATVKAGEGLAEIETDKAVMVFESFDQGVLLARLIEVGDTVPLGTPIAILGKAGEDVAALEAEARKKVAAALAGGAAKEPTAAESPKEPTATESPKEPTAAKQAKVAKAESEAEEEGSAEAARAAKGDKPAAGDAEPKAPATAAKAPVQPTPAARVSAQPSAPVDLTAEVDEDGRRIAASPLARRVAAQRGLSLQAVQGSGPRGRVVVADLEWLAPSRKLSGRLARRAQREDEVVRVTQMRKTIAKRLVASKQEAPHYYLTIEVDAGRLVALRADLNQALELQTPKGETPRKVSYNDLVLRACVVALAKHPKVNAAWEGTTIRQFAGVHLGFAVALPDGLISPVVRDADRLDLFELSDAVKDLAARARDNTLESAEYAGNSFCVSNLGMFGIDHFTAVINPPAACILAVGALVEAPLVKHGQPVAGHRLTMTLSCDHRAVDGSVGAAFLADLRKVLEAPSALLL